jgi:hypothetical protein
MCRKLPQSDDIFSYYTPHKELIPYIAYYSISEQSAILRTIDPIFIPDLGGSIIITCNKNDIEMTVWGPLNLLTSIEHRSIETQSQYFIEFQPGGLSRLLYQNSNEILNGKIPLSDIDSRIATSIRPIFEGDIQVDTLITALDYYFLNLLERRKDIFENGRYILKLLQNFTVNKKNKRFIFGDWLFLKTYQSLRE